LTRKRQNDLGGELVRAPEACWAQIRAEHPEVPTAMLITSAGSLGPRVGVRLGHFAASRWRTDGEVVIGEVFVGGEGMARGTREVLATLLPWRRGRIPTVGIGRCDRGSVVARVGMLATRRVVKACGQPGWLSTVRHFNGRDSESDPTCALKFREPELRFRNVWLRRS
jgi:hypothetical protein